MIYYYIINGVGFLIGGYVGYIFIDNLILFLDMNVWLVKLGGVLGGVLGGRLRLIGVVVDVIFIRVMCKYGV